MSGGCVSALLVGSQLCQSSIIRSEGICFYLLWKAVANRTKEGLAFIHYTFQRTKSSYVLLAAMYIHFGLRPHIVEDEHGPMVRNHDEYGLK
jgi:hypothetical protein